MQSPAITHVIDQVRAKTPVDAATLLGAMPPDIIRDVLSVLPTNQALTIASLLPGTCTESGADAAAMSGKLSGKIGELLEPITGIVSDDQTVSFAVDLLVHHKTPDDVSYVYVVNAQKQLVGVFGMRDLLLSKPSQRVADIMVPNPVAFTADTDIRTVMQATLKRHLSRYPVVDDSGVPIGLIRGGKLFERAISEIGNQAGSLVGVGREERVNTSVMDAFRMRHPWLQVNLLTAFMAAFVVSMFEDTISRSIALAAFLPVLAGQSGNTGCQALAITLRGMTLGELAGYPVARLLRKEILLGALNGAVVGVVAAVAMWAYAGVSGAAHPAKLALVILVAMIGSCIGSGIFGVMVPITLRRFGADPAMASSIFLTTFTDIMGMGLMLFLAASLVL